jgi:hypothetical protein
MLANECFLNPELVKYSPLFSILGALSWRFPMRKSQVMQETVWLKTMHYTLPQKSHLASEGAPG